MTILAEVGLHPPMEQVDQAEEDYQCQLQAESVTLAFPPGEEALHPLHRHLAEVEEEAEVDHRDHQMYRHLDPQGMPAMHLLGPSHTMARLMASLLKRSSSKSSTN